MRLKNILIEPISKLFFYPTLPSDSLKGEPLTALNSVDSPLGARGKRWDKNRIKIILRSVLVKVVIFWFAFSPLFSFSQVQIGGENLDLDYAHPKEYIIGGIVVTGP